LSIALLILYTIGGRMIAKLEKDRTREVLEKEASEGDYAHITARRAYTIFVISAIAVVALGIWLSYIGDQLAASTGLSRSFVGNLFLASATSLPEISASLAAIRLGAIDLAIGNVLGSNLFNIVLFLTYDIADGQRNFWATLNNANGFAAVMAIMMTAVVTMSLMVRASPRSPSRFSWDGVVLVVMYIGAIIILYRLG
jgi:cation:H+ antiporter